MAGLQIAEAGSPDLTKRFKELSSWISGNFGAPWHAEPVGADHSPSTIQWASSEGVTISRASMSPLRLFNPGRDHRRSDKYYVYTANQPTLLKLEGSPPLHLQPDELVILAANTPCEYLMWRHYITSSLVIDGDLFHEYLPEPLRVLGRRLILPFGLDSVLHHTIQSAWELSEAGMFEASGRRFVRSFLELLALAPPPEETSERRRPSGLSIRCSQVRAYIDRNFSQPALTVMSVAEHFQLSPRYIQQALSLNGVTPGEYLRNRRLRAAANLLRDPSQAGRSITQIAFDCGFNSSGYFATEFRRAHGMSPRAYRSSTTPGKQ